MRRTNSTTTPRIYAYGTLTPTSGFKAATDELRRQYDLWDTLVDLERAHQRTQLDHAIAANPQIRDLSRKMEAQSALIDAALTKRRELRRAARAKVATPELDAEIKNAFTARNETRKELYTHLRTWRKENKSLLKLLEQERRAAVKQASQQSPCYWGNKARVIDDYERSRRTVAKLGRSLRYADRERAKGVLHIGHPAFNAKRQAGEPTGLSFKQLLKGDCSALTIAAVDPRAWDEQTPRGERRRLARTTMSMRIDALGNRLELPLVLHRPVPEHARIKCAQLTWYEEGERRRFQLCLTLALPRPTSTHPSTAACGIDFGWRKHKGELLIATMASSSLGIRRYTLSQRWMERMDRVERLTGYLDDETLLLAHQITAEQTPLPPLLQQAFERWHPGLSSRYIDTRALHDGVRELGFDVPAIVLRWYKRYRHLLLYRDNLRAKLLRQRREHYRLIAREIAQAHHTVTIEDMDLAAMARSRKRLDGSDPKLHASARAQRQRACLYQLRHELSHQVAKANGEFVLATGPSTMACRQCGTVNRPSDRAAQHWVCEGCNTIFDQDENAAANLLALSTGERFGETSNEWKSHGLTARVKA